MFDPAAGLFAGRCECLQSVHQALRDKVRHSVRMVHAIGDLVGTFTPDCQAAPLGLAHEFFVAVFESNLSQFSD